MIRTTCWYCRARLREARRTFTTNAPAWLLLGGCATVLYKDLHYHGLRGSGVPEPVRRAHLHEIRLSGRRFHRSCRTDGQLEFTGNGNKQVKPNIVVGIHAADGTRLELDACDTNFGAVYLPYRSDARVGTGRLGAGVQCIKQCQSQTRKSGWDSHGSPPGVPGPPQQRINDACSLSPRHTLWRPATNTPSPRAMSLAMNHAPILLRRQDSRPEKRILRKVGVHVRPHFDNGRYPHALHERSVPDSHAVPRTDGTFHR